jgi:signal peptidase I
MAGTRVDAAPRTPADRPREPLRLAWVLLMVPIGLLLVFGAPLLIRTAVVEAFEFEGPSMCPTICNEERMTVDKTAYGLFLPFTAQQTLSWAMPRAGDIVLFRSPADEVNVIKRVVGVPGDRIEVIGDRVIRNGAALPRAEVACPGHMPPGPYRRKCFREQLGSRAYAVVYERTQFDPLPAVVPAEQLYVLGDNRTSSNDSRNPAMGTVHRSRLKGRVTRIYWSPHADRRLLVPQ